MIPKKVFVSGCYDLLHSGHVEFFRQASRYGDLYVGIGSDETILHYKKHRTVYPERERLFMVKAIRYVKDAFINAGSGIMDFVPTVEQLRPDVFVVNEDGASKEKEEFCRRMGMEYIVLPRTPSEGLKARSSTDLKKETCMIPTRLDLAGTWIDQPYVSRYGSGWAITISLVPDFEIRERCGLSTSTRNCIRSMLVARPRDQGRPARGRARDPRPPRILFRERPRAVRRHHLGGARRHRHLHARAGAPLL